ncbi:MAG: hypothetical protein NTW21_17145 [Verrucomicrobia bacterium]|nr:hypothetical protein [Verrucomicrobiota bacterium]
MPAIYHPRRPRASPLWQIVTAAWESFVAGYGKIHRATMEPLRPHVIAGVRNFLRSGDRGCGVPPQAVDGASRAANSNAAATSVPPVTSTASATFPRGSPPPSAMRSPTASSSLPSRGRMSQIPTRLVPAPNPDGPADPPAETPPPAPVLIVPPPPLRTARSMRPLWRDLIRCSGVSMTVALAPPLNRSRLC